ncbi:MAG: tetratricopeptide repeat protein [Flavobacteriales bacterium]
MSRLHLTLILSLLTIFIDGQVKLKDLISFGDEQFQKGDYYYASKIYDQAIQMDSMSVDLHWKQAETQRAYKNYAEAASWYAKVYAADPEMVYPNALIYYALMVKQTGDYSKALALFKKAYKEAATYPDGFAYIRAKQEIKSTEFAIKSTAASIHTPLVSMPDSVNSFDAEFGHLFKNGIFYFSSLKADSINTNEEVYTKFYRTRTYKSNFDSLNQSFSSPKQWEQLSAPERSTGNGCFDDKGWYYYSICKDKGYNYQCKIARFKEENGADQIDTLPAIINMEGSNTTNPCWVKLKNGKSYLFFSSDREGGKGGMDIWLAAIKTNGTFDTPKNLSSINSIEHEITPWMDVDSNRLYFSSPWHYGYGGYDVFESNLSDKMQFSKPKNMGKPINSPANDLYFFRQADSVFVSSNRLGSKSKKNPTCCSDIYVATIERPVIPPPKDSIHTDSNRIEFPVALYFRNDYPNPKSYAKKSNLPYDLLYVDYVKARKGYLDSVSDKPSLATFFTSKVDQGYTILLKLYDSVRNELARGNSVQLFARGYASPLNVTQYNVNLTQRRISSVQKFFLEYQNGALKEILDKNKSISLEIVEVPLGEFAANQNTSDNLQDKASSVYSVAASIERKVEILYMTRIQHQNLQRITAEPLVQEDEIKEGNGVTKRIVINHDASELELSEVRFSQEGLQYEMKSIAENESEILFMFTPLFTGKHASCYADLYFEDIKEPLRVYFTFLKK